MQMFLVALEDGAASHQPPNECYRRVEQGYAKRHHGYRNRHHGRPFGGPLDGEAGKQKTCEHAARVAQERPCRRKVERKKPEERASQCGGHQADGRVTQYD
jgi:hypothetical protein